MTTRTCCTPRRYSIRRELTSVRPRLRPCPFLGSVASPRSAHATFAAASPGACRLRPVVSPPQPEGAPRAPARDASDLALARARDAPLSDGGQRRRGARRWHQQPHRRGAASASLATCRSRPEAAARRTCCRPAAGQLAWRESAAPAIHRVAGWDTYGCRVGHMGVQGGAHGLARRLLGRPLPACRLGGPTPASCAAARELAAVERLDG